MSNISELESQVRKLKKCCCQAQTITFEKSIELVENSEVRKGVLYRITGVHKNKVGVTIPVLYDDGTNSGTTIYVWGLTATEFSTEGWGEFYNPKYDQTNYGTPDIRAGQAVVITTPGTDYSSGVNVPTTGGTGVGMTLNITAIAGAVTAVFINTVGSGYVDGDVITITDGNDDATITIEALNYLYNIYDGDNPYHTIPTYMAIGTQVFWGGYVWESITGNYSGAISATELNTDDFSKIAYNTTDYDLVIDYIEYDRPNDWILRRRQAEPVIDVIFPYQYWNSVENTYGVVLHGIAVMQWGNNYKAATELGIGLIDVKDAYAELVNFKGKLFLGLTLTEYSVKKDEYFGINTEFRTEVLKGKSYQTNNKFDTGSKQSDILLEAQSYQNLIELRNNSIQAVITMRGGWQDGQDGFLLDNGSSQGNITINGGYQAGALYDNASTESSATYINGGYSTNMLLDSSQISNWLIDNTVVGHQLTNCIKSDIIFRNNASIAPTDSDTGERHSLYEYSYSEFVIPLVLSSGTAGNGAVGNINIPKFDLPVVGSYIESVVVNCGNLTAGAGAYITLGIVTDDVDSGLDSVTGLVTTITNATNIYTALPFTRTAAANRYLVMAVGVAGITGAVNIIVKVRRGLY